MSEQAGADYDAAVRSAEADYTAVYERAHAAHAGRVRTSEMQLESDVTPAREARDAALARALAKYEAAVGIVRDEPSSDLPDDVVEKFDADVAAAEEGQA